MKRPADVEVPGVRQQTPNAAHEVFGERLALAEAYAAELCSSGLVRGLIGPREVSRIWDRHLLNCAVINDSFPPAVRVVDVGSGAGLPGIALAIARPDLEIHLVEPMLRRTTWLADVVGDLGLDGVTVHRARAEEVFATLSAPFVTARAVARLGRLARWCVPLLTPNGTVVAMKGQQAQSELEQDRRSLGQLGLVDAVVSTHGAEILSDPVVTVDLRFDRGRPSRPRRRSSH